MATTIFREIQSGVDEILKIFTDATLNEKFTWVQGSLAAILTVVGCMLAHFVFFVYMFGLLNMFSALFFSVTSIFSDVFSIVFLVLGACIAYQTAR